MMHIFSLPTTLIPPEDVNITDITEDSISLKWTPPFATYDYILISCVNSKGGNNVTDNVTSGNTGVCTGLTPGAIYTIEVSIINSLVDPETTVVDPNTVTSM